MKKLFVSLTLLTCAGVAAGGAWWTSARAAASLPPTSLDLRNTDTGEPLDLSMAQEEGRDTPGVRKFFQTGVDPYLEDKSCLKKGEVIYLEACSGCHGHVGEGKIGPGLNDDYWTYPKNETDQGLFETIFGGARAQMGPHYDLTLDEILKVMAWVRHLYKDDVKHAPWLTDAQKKNFRPFKVGEKFPEDAPGMCAADKTHVR
ncbi:cytochrome cL apoprotein [Nitrospirillum amazonense]|uniref:Cytochrome cL apoprotein n=1 Tax=Nitrospirillum amazonense TaxID=28077 RepID=A0A560FP68_9PROT|nr:cytochrome c(L), periplasmic [Nitrospirillum amazonense]TWB23392.1 cytochrome cL apoprotein [Nitrospirillum amazonense]